jgi:hypothetical protein
MSSTGYLDSAGHYHRASKVPLAQMVQPLTSTWKQGDHHRQRFDHAAEIVQPYTWDGKPNPELIEVNPDEAVHYGFLPGELNHDPEAYKSAEGSTPWGE